MKKNKKKTPRPTVEFDSSSGCFKRDGKNITDEQALEQWEEVGSAGYTVGAFNELSRRVLS